MENLHKFLDPEGKINKWPTRREYKLEVLTYLASKFEPGRDYKEKEVNEIIESWHSFSDYFQLRRELIDNRLLFRTRDGSRYWREEEKDE